MKTTRSLNTTSCVFAACVLISLQIGWFCNLNPNPLCLHQLQTVTLLPVVEQRRTEETNKNKFLSFVVLLFERAELETCAKPAG